MAKSQIATNQPQTAVGVLMGLMDNFGKPIPEEYRTHSVGTEPINLLDRSLNTKVGVLRCCSVDESAIRAYKITEEELEKYSVSGHWSNTFSRILSARKEAYQNRKGEI